MSSIGYRASIYIKVYFFLSILYFYFLSEYLFNCIQSLRRSMADGDFFGSEQSHIMESQGAVKIVLKKGTRCFAKMSGSPFYFNLDS